MSIVSVIFFSAYKVWASVHPQVDTVFLSLSSQGDPFFTPIDLTENSDTALYVYGQFEDADGCHDVMDSGDLSLVFYRSGVLGGDNCTANNSNCYRASYLGGTCFIMGCDPESLETVASYECSIPLKFYADPTDDGPYVGQNWQARVVVTDASSTSGSMTTSTGVNSLISIQVDPNISYGTVDIGVTSTTDTEMAIINTGNRSVDLDVSGIDMICDHGVIPVTAQHFSATKDTAYENMFTLFTSNTAVSLNLLAQSGEAQSTSSLYFKLTVPTGVNGNCSGSNTINAKVHE